MRVTSRWTGPVMLFGLSACVSMGPDYDVASVAQLKPGVPKAEVIATLGRPTSTVTLADGRQQLMWVHSRGTMLGTARARSATLLFSPTGEYLGISRQAETDIR